MAVVSLLAQEFSHMMVARCHGVAVTGSRCGCGAGQRGAPSADRASQVTAAGGSCAERSLPSRAACGCCSVGSGHCGDCGAAEPSSVNCSVPCRSETTLHEYPGSPPWGYRHSAFPVTIRQGVSVSLGAGRQSRRPPGPDPAGSGRQPRPPGPGAGGRPPCRHRPARTSAGSSPGSPRPQHQARGFRTLL
jgi:hypothetical protein